MIKHRSAKLTLSAALIISSIALGLGGCAQLGSLPVSSLTGGTSSGSPVDVGTLMSNQKGLMNRFNSAMNNMLKAQENTTAALGNKKQAEELAAAAQNFSTGNVQDADQVARAVKLSKEASDTIAEASTKKQQVSAEGKSMLVAAVPHYVKGLADGSGLFKEFQEWALIAQNGLGGLTSNPMDAVKLKGGLGDATTVITNLPELAKVWGITTTAFVTYAKSNKVEVAGVESKLGTL